MRVMRVMLGGSLKHVSVKLCVQSVTLVDLNSCKEKALFGKSLFV